MLPSPVHVFITCLAAKSDQEFGSVDVIGTALPRRLERITGVSRIGSRRAPFKRRASLVQSFDQSKVSMRRGEVKRPTFVSIRISAKSQDFVHSFKPGRRSVIIAAYNRLPFFLS